MAQRFLCLLLAAGIAFAADEPKRIDTSLANQNLIKKVEPTIPPLAKTVGIGGIVAMDITISPEGTVSSFKVLSGHPLLVQSCIDAVKKWVYKPFIQDGHATAVVTSVQCTFESPNYTKSEEKALRDYYPTFHACYELVHARKNLDAERKCAEAVSLSEELPSNRILERSSSRTFLAHSLVGEGKPKDAIPHYEKAIDIRKGMEHSDRDADFASEHANLARAYFMVGELNKADLLYDRSITIYEAAIIALPSMMENYRARLKSALLEYAKLKSARGEMDKAKALEQKAAGLQTK